MLQRVETIKILKALEAVPVGEDIFIAAPALAGCIMEYDKENVNKPSVGELQSYIYPFIMEVNEFVAFSDVHEFGYVVRDMVLFLRGDLFQYGDGVTVKEMMGINGQVEKCMKASSEYETSFIALKNVYDDIVESMLNTSES